MADYPMRSPIADLLPLFMQQFREFEELLRTEELEMKQIEQSVFRTLGCGFVDDCDEYGISRYETMYRITPKASDTLDDRKFRLKTKINEQTPYTLPKLREILKNLCGDGNCTADVIVGTYDLIVRVGLAAKNNYTDVESLLERIVPQNMVITLSLLYNPHALVGQYTHAQLATLTHEQIKSEVLDNA